MADKYELLKGIFGYDRFRPAQEDIIDNILSGRDVLAVMPTGAGKSLCFQIPALLMEGITLVISPLISLMTDQVASLKEAGVNAAYLNSSLTAAQQYKATENIRKGLYKIIYVAPERLETEQFISAASEINISMVAVDEAHCISQWGQDFRPSYMNIVDFIKGLPRRPVITAFTATATERVKEDISKTLELKAPYSVTTGFDRPNLYFGVIHERNREQLLIQMIKEAEGKSGIVYCSTRKNTEKIAQLLKANNIPSAPYHAGLSDEMRKQVQEDFIYDRIRVIAATNAFGMGIDKSNVSFVYHYNMPKDIESYYQEAGRAGRDGEAADCILFFSGSDYVTNKFIIEEARDNPNEDESERKIHIRRDLKRLGTMMDYCTGAGCLRQFILGYFGEKTSGQCGNCSYCLKASEKRNVTVEAQKILSCIVRVRQNYGMSTVIDVLKGSKAKKITALGFDRLSTYNIMSEYSAENIRYIISSLIALGYITKEGDEYPILKVTPKANAVLRGQKEIEINMPVSSSEQKAKKSRAAETEYAIDNKLFDRLKQLRSKIAYTESIPAYIVFSDAALRDMCAKLPRTDEEMLNVSGVGKMKLEKYGDKFLAEIAAHISENGTGEKIAVNEAAIQDPLSAIAEKVSELKTSEEALSLSAFTDMLISEISLNIKYQPVVKILFGWLENEGLILSLHDDEGHLKRTTSPMSEYVGIFSEKRTGMKGQEYSSLMFSTKAQQFIIDSLPEIVEFGRSLQNNEKAKA